MDQNGNVKYFHSDHLGTTRLMTDGSGNAIDAAVTTAFGELVGENLETRYGYVGGYGYEQVAGSGQPAGSAFDGIHVGFRWYSPSTGRFLQRDPIGYAGGMNLYEYVGSSAVGYFDPLGLQEDPPGYHGPVVRQPRKQSGNPSSGAPKRGPRKSPEKNKYNTGSTDCKAANAMRREIEDLADEIDDLNNTIDQLNNDIGKLDGSIRQLLTQEGVLCKLLIEAESGRIDFEEASDTGTIGSMGVALIAVFIPGGGLVVFGAVVAGVVIDGAGLYFAMKSGDRAAIVQAIKDNINEIDLQKAYARGQIAAKSAEIARRQNEIKNKRNRIQELLKAADKAQATCDEEKKSNHSSPGETGGHGGGGRKGGGGCDPYCTKM